MRPLSPHRWNGIILKVVSLIFGCAFWYMFMQHQVGFHQFSVPVCFHDVPEDISIEAPELIDIIIRGKQSELKKLKKTPLAFHVDAHQLKKGKNNIHLSKKYLFLPEQFRLLNHSPSTILVYVNKKHEPT